MSTLITDKVDNAAVQKEKLDTSAYLPHTPWLQFLLVCCLFALWGMAGNLNDILIAQFKKGFDLTDTQTALVQSIFFLGYFFVALPAAALIKRFSYKAAIIIGLCLYALGCFLFVPAAQIMTYGAFLACLGVIACGLSFLETSANTYSSLLGPIQSSTQRINFSQIFNSLGVISGVLIGQLMVFGENDPSHEQLLAMPAAAADVARHQMVGQVVGPYLIIGSVLVVLALVFVFIKFPSCKGAPAQQQQLPTESMGPTLKRLFAIPRFRLGILSQFLYVGAQVGVWSFTIRFVQLVQQGTSEHSATYWLLASLVILSLSTASGACVRGYNMRELINTIAHIGYQVSDLTRSLAFYEPLGFQRQQRFSKPSPQGTIEVAFLEMAGAVLELYQLPAGTPFDAPRCGIDHLALEVSDLDAVQQRLAELGYPIDEGPTEEDNVRFLLIRGPDGERLEFDACKR
ncbi:MFS transporter [Klebsiella pneumoniae]|nr:MFS transporter [Klebsiella pneumoniae]